MGIEENEIASGRGLAVLSQVGRTRPVIDYRLIKHHDENTTTQIGVLDFSQSRKPLGDGRLMWLRGDGPLTVPTSALSTDSLEVSESESLLLCSLAAMNLLERAAAGAPASTRQAYQDRISRLGGLAADLSQGAGQARDAASYSLGW